MARTTEDKFEIHYLPRWWPEPKKPLERSLTDGAIAVLNDVEHLATARQIGGFVPPVVVLWGVLRRWNKSGRLGLAVLEASG